MSVGLITDVGPISSSGVCLSVPGMRGKNVAMLFCSCCPPKLEVPGAISCTWASLVTHRLTE